MSALCRLGLHKWACRAFLGGYDEWCTRRGCNKRRIAGWLS